MRGQAARVTRDTASDKGPPLGCARCTYTPPPHETTLCGRSGPSAEIQTLSLNPRADMYTQGRQAVGRPAAVARSMYTAEQEEQQWSVYMYLLGGPTPLTSPARARSGFYNSNSD